jgi:L-ascorbate metabolism protein UlaG (beta-lactamase superfamily)
MLKHGNVEITWLGHDGFKLKAGTVVYVDPYQLTSAQEPADLVCVTHEHFDHLSVEDLKRVVAKATTLIGPAACEAGLKSLGAKTVHVVAPGDRIEVDGVSVEAVAAYNTNKFREPGKPFHPQADGKVGYVIGLGGIRIYHAGDTDHIPEMGAAAGVDVALLPVSGTYVMTPDEAILACKAIGPKLAIPMHYGSIVGSAADAEAFRTGADCRVEVLTPEP